ncbi:MAG: Crp/Fnr family transcriptional regulator [Cytophagales bacterium]|nr:Crp/Fnr family transcriptional regulator [Cytophagales bacterium]
MQKLISEIFIRAGFHQKLIDEISLAGRGKRAEPGEVVISPYDDKREIPILLKGLLKVSSIDEDGNELFLYYLGGGEICPMSLACCINGEGALFSLVAEESSSLWMIPAEGLDSWMEKYPDFRKYVMASYQMRFQELMSTIDSLVFHDLKERLLNYLLDTKQATGSYIINKTHQQIANELNSSRVVISRLLKKFEKEHIIEQHRNQIEIL